MESLSHRTRASHKENRFPNDTLLRKLGWRILSRPNKGDDVWIHASGIEMTTKEVLKSIKEMAKVVENVDEH